ncbi:DUF5615 family PIN-like protein [Nitrospirillum sp. BR 11752]|uniref:DUF5615 family PIN-like protein n=1 Tax=Nitrospirillum sp. BR 11752 TaxID=3104293 RepID=UPI002E9E2D17|nr:DUF5615 family PIN-like protein [Nitrospirillum sp. BR 11752]
MAPRFLIDENLSPQVARHLRDTLGYDAAHVNEVGLSGPPDDAVLAWALERQHIVVTSNADDFRRLGRASPGHPGLAILLDAVGRQQQVALTVILAEAVEARLQAGEPAAGQLFEVDRAGAVRVFPLP